MAKLSAPNGTFIAAATSSFLRITSTEITGHCDSPVVVHALNLSSVILRNPDA
jgi:hypothetical protein